MIGAAGQNPRQSGQGFVRVGPGRTAIPHRYSCRGLPSISRATQNANQYTADQPPSNLLHRRYSGRAGQVRSVLSLTRRLDGVVPVSCHQSDFPDSLGPRRRPRACRGAFSIVSAIVQVLFAYEALDRSPCPGNGLWRRQAFAGKNLASSTGDQLGAGWHSLIDNVCPDCHRLARSRAEQRRLVTLSALESWRKKTPRVTDWQTHGVKAGDEIRTHDIHVGNVTHYANRCQERAEADNSGQVSGTGGR